MKKKLSFLVVILSLPLTLHAVLLIPTNLQFAAGTLKYIGKKIKLTTAVKQLKRLSRKRKLSLAEITPLPSIEVETETVPLPKKTVPIMENCESSFLETVDEMEEFLTTEYVKELYGKISEKIYAPSVLFKSEAPDLHGILSPVDLDIIVRIKNYKTLLERMHMTLSNPNIYNNFMVTWGNLINDHCALLETK